MPSKESFKISQGWSNFCTKGIFRILKEFSLQWCINQQKMLRIVHTGAVYVHALALTHSSRCTLFQWSTILCVSRSVIEKNRI
jgi:hypothetical protein